ncbi:MAG: terminase [Bacteroidales bacterium]|nr:terminase [Bacteroidales bacterium]
MKSAEREQKQSLAKILFLQGMLCKDISEKIGVSTNTISKWSVAGSWQEERAARTITRPQLVMKMLQELDKKITDGDWKPQDVAMVAAAISKLDKQTNVVTVIEVFTKYQGWLAKRAEIDPDLDADFLKKTYHYQDKFINEQMSNTAIN